ncbi:MAG: hypothetical protein U9Q81_06825 [Pseudomonadota bacterium]|nr:hypothetical protein [Pseudomonadota bacterium]
MHAQQHQACDSPFFSFDDPSPAALREIAASCEHRPVAMLFYNRAYHKEVLGDLRLLTGLHTYGTSEDQIRYEQSRIFIALAEELARRAWESGSCSGIASLNAAYDQAIETVEYTIKGYNLLIGGVAGEE